MILNLFVEFIVVFIVLFILIFIYTISYKNHNNICTRCNKICNTDINKCENKQKCEEENE